MQWPPHTHPNTPHQLALALSHLYSISFYTEATEHSSHTKSPLNYFVQGCSILPLTTRTHAIQHQIHTHTHHFNIQSIPFLLIYNWHLGYVVITPNIPPTLFLTLSPPESSSNSSVQFYKLHVTNRLSSFVPVYLLLAGLPLHTYHLIPSINTNSRFIWTTHIHQQIYWPQGRVAEHQWRTTRPKPTRQRWSSWRWPRSTHLKETNIITFTTSGNNFENCHAI